MDREYVQLHGVVDRYVAGRLSPEEAAAFEEHYLQCRDTLEEVELAWTLRRGLEEIHASSPEQPRSLPSLVRSRPIASAALAAAAALVFLLPAALALMLLRENADLQQRLAALTAPEPNVPVATLVRSRSFDTPAQSIALDPGAQRLMLEVDPGGGAGGPYALTIEEAATERRLMNLQGLRRDDRGYLVAALPAQKLSRGLYRVRLRGSGDSGPQSFLIEIE